MTIDGRVAMNGSLERHETERYLDPWDTFGFVPDESRIEVKWFIGASAETEVVRCLNTANNVE
jgi:hypothetical protein